MVQKIIQLLNKEFTGINQAALLLGLFALLSRIIAIVRDRAFAHYLGADIELDVYYAAFKIPDLLYVSFGSLVAVTVLLPFLVQKLSNGSQESARRFLGGIFTTFLLFMIAICTIAFVAMPKIAPLVTPGFSGEALEQVILLGRIMLLSPILLGLSNLFGSVTQLFRRFVVFALSPVLYNIGIVLGIIFLYPTWGIEGLAIGVVIGAFLHMVIQLPVLLKERFIPRFSFSIPVREIVTVLKLSLPRTLGLSLSTIAFTALIAFASTITEGSISIFQLSYNLQSVPLGIIGVSYAVAAFPTLAQSFSSNNIQQFLRQLETAARQIIFWTLPATFLFIVLRAQIVRVILGTGEFTWTDTRLTAAALACFAISIVFQSLVLLFVKAYYAAGKTARPVLVNIFSTALIIVLAYLLTDLFSVPSVQYFLESLLRIEGVDGSKIIMLPIAFSIGTIVNFFIIWMLFKRDFRHTYIPAFLRNTFFQSVTASFMIGAASYSALVIFAPLFDLYSLWGIFLQGFCAGVVGIVVGVAVLRLMGNREITEVMQAVRGKFWKQRNVVAGLAEEEVHD